MPTYTAHFRSDDAFACHDFEAETPEEALALARQYDPSGLWVDAYPDMPVNEIIVCDPDGNEVTAWCDDELRLALAASNLRVALEIAVSALNTQPRFAVPNLGTDSYKIAAQCERALAMTKSGSP
jgi:hypothetical protein